MKAFRKLSRGRRYAAVAVGVAVALLLVWLFFLRGGGSEVAPVAQPTPVATPGAAGLRTLDQYKSALRGALREVERAEAATGAERDGAVGAALRELRSVEGASVTPPGQAGSTATVSNAALIEELEAADPDLAGVEASLNTLIVSLEAAGAEASGDPRSALREVLSDPAFNYERELSPIEQLARWLAGITGEADPSDTLWRWVLSFMVGLIVAALTFMALAERLPSKGARLFVSTIAGTLAGVLFFFASRAVNMTLQILGVVGIGVAALVAVLFLFGLRRGGTAPAAPRKVSDLASVLGMGAGEAGRRAGEAAGQGDYRAAIRYRCLAVLLRLDEADLLHFDRSATNSEYLFKAPGNLQEGLQPLLAQFSAVWYGNMPATQSDWQDYTTRAEALESQIRPKSGGRQAA